MPRCACGANTCSCAITPGAGVQIVGHGSVSDPWVVSLDPSTVAIGNIVSVQDTPTIHMEQNGSGSSSDPLVIRSDLTANLVDLADVQDSPAPTDGQVPTWHTDHWEFQTPAVPPGTVTVVNPISGDGSAGTPLGLKTSGTWGSPGAGVGQPGLDKWGTDPLVGQPIYVDTNGQVRTAPVMIPDASYKPASAMPVEYPYGVSVMTLAGTHPADGGWPGPFSATVTTFRRHAVDGDGVCAQWWQRNTAGATPQVMYRSGNTGSGWSAWSYAVDPPVPAPVDTYVTTDQAVTSTSRGTESPTQVRASITNPHPMRRLLVRHVVRSLILSPVIGSTGQAVYVEVLPISGGVEAVGPAPWRIDTPSAGGQLYAAVDAEGYYWVAAGGTYLAGVAASRSGSNALTLRNCHNSLIPIRYE